jgi:hypothetical protein
MAESTTVLEVAARLAEQVAPNIKTRNLDAEP